MAEPPQRSRLRVTMIAALAALIVVVGGASLISMAPAQDAGSGGEAPAADSGVAADVETEPAKPKTKPKKPKTTASAAKPASLWAKRCGTTSSGSSRCQMEHLIVDSKKRQVLRFAVMTINDQQALSVWAPLGLLIPFGVHVKVDDAKTRKLELVSCDARSCRAVLGIDDGFLKELSSGQRIVVVIKDGASGKDIALPGSLQGFSATYAKTFKAAN